MRKLTTYFKVACCAVILLATACKKNKTDESSITADELLEYRIISTLINENNEEGLRMFHFTKNGNQIQCNADYIGTRRVTNVAINNNSFTVDMDGDGKIVYTFNLAKANDGSIVIKSHQFKNTNAPNFKSWIPEIYKASDVMSVKNLWFVGNNFYNLHMMTETWAFYRELNVTGTFYEIFPGAWKGTLGGVNYFGVRLKTTRDSKLLLQKNGEAKIITLYQD